jgi:DNA repair protein RadD
MLRPYQKTAHDKIVAWIKRTTEPCMIEAATGAGKSHIIAALADTVLKISGKRVLVLAPSKELVEQNHEKYPGQSSIFSASAGMKCLEHPVVFGTPMTVKNSIERFGDEFALVILDECHGITPTFQEIVDSMPNPNLRVVGMSATPYRMGSGYVFRQWPDGAQAGTRGYFTRCVYRITARELIDQGYLTPPVVGSLRADSYKTKHMRLNSMGQFSKEDVDRAYHGQGRKTAAIIADIVAQSQDRMGVLIFAATVRHAQECLDSLPPELSAIVTAKTPPKERASILSRFKRQEIKYIVNVSVLTTGFDATHVDVIAMLRATESVGLMQQIIGRGLRLHDGKEDCLVLDYAQNIERHCPDGDIFNPEVEEKKTHDAEDLECYCPTCETRNVFRARPNPDRYRIDRHGYFVDLDGFPIEGDFGPIPAHYGRRCTAVHLIGNELRQCSSRWTAKECPKCKTDNDIAARQCVACNEELVDPNEKLRLAFENKKKDPTILQTDEVVGWKMQNSISRAGRAQIMVTVVTPYRSFKFWVPHGHAWGHMLALQHNFDRLKGEKPTTITYKKDYDTKFYKVYAFNEKADEAPK